MADFSEKCFSCLKPKNRASGGFVTQFIDVCRCAEVKEERPADFEPLPTCNGCRKSINRRRSGSMTQWIFRADFCRCEIPQPLDRQCGRASGPEKHAFVLLEDDGDELPLSPESFPSDRYQPKVKLGAGASGTVYLSRDRLLGKWVAVKLLHELTANQLMAFQEEARTTSRLHHPNIIQILDFGPTESGVPYMVLEYIDRAKPLQQYLSENGPADLQMTVRIFHKVCSALTHAHESGVFHRDLKPSNILLADTTSGDPDVKLIDFGVAKVKYENQEPTIVQGRTIVGTPAYMPPEIVSGAVYDANSETYTLGCVLFETLTGRPPFLGESALETLAMHSSHTPPRLKDVYAREYPQALETVVARCLAKNPKDRYADLEELEDALDAIISPIPPLQPSSEGDEDDYTDSDRYELKEHIDIPLRTVSETRQRSASLRSIAGAGSVVVLGGLLLSAEIWHRTPSNVSSAAPQVKSEPIGDGRLSTLASNLGMSDQDAIVDSIRNNSAFKIEVPSQTWHAIERLKDADLKRLYERHRETVRNLRLAGGSIEGQVDLTDTAFGYISKLKLRLLDAQRCSIHDSGLQMIAKMRTLRVLDLTDTMITDKGVAYLGKSPIEDLNIASCLFLTNKCVASLAKMPNLKVLNCSTTDLTDSVFKDFAKMKLEELRVSNTSITDQAMLYLGSNRTIKKLHISSTGVTIDGLRAIKYLPLEAIKVQSCKNFNDECLSLIAMQWPNMTVVDIDNTDVTGKGLQALGNMRRLNLVTLAGVKCVDRDVKPLLASNTITSLNLSETKVTDATLIRAAAMPRLEKIFLSKCEGITSEGIEALKSAGKDVANAQMIGGTPVNKEALEALIGP